MSGGVTMASGSRWVVSCTAAMAPAPTQKPLTQQWRAATTTPMAVWPGRPEPGGEGSIVTHGRNRDRGEQTTRRRRGGTVMRHFLLSRPVTAHSGGVPPPAMRARLISPPSRLQGPLPCPGSAAAVTVDLPPIAAAANDYLASAAGAQEQTATSNPGLL